MKKIILVGLTIFTITGCAQKVSFLDLSKEIYNKHNGHLEKNPFKINAYKQEARNAAYNKSKKSFIYEPLDTLFVIDTYNVETASISGTILGNKNHINYLYDRQGLALLKESSFTKYQLKLVSEWDTISIRKEEKRNEIPFGGGIINANRCFIRNGKWVIEYINFKDFFNLKRDQ